VEPGGQGQLPSGQTAKAHSDYRVQSLYKGHGRHALHQSKYDYSDTQNECLFVCGHSRPRFGHLRKRDLLGLRQQAGIRSLEALHLLLQLRVHLVRDGHDVGKQLSEF
jgi:hypothetical protein